MRRTHVALLFAAAALATTAYAIYAGITCGASESSADAADAPAAGGDRDVGGGSRCVSWVHPFLPAYGLAALATFPAIWRERPGVPLFLAVVGGAFGTLAGFTLGLVGIAISLLLVGAGIALSPRSPVGWAALVAALAPLPALIVLSQRGASGILSAWLIAFLPMVLWLGYSAWWKQEKSTRPSGPS